MAYYVIREDVMLYLSIFNIIDEYVLKIREFYNDYMMIIQEMYN